MPLDPSVWSFSKTPTLVLVNDTTKYVQKKACTSKALTFRTHLYERNTSQARFFFLRCCNGHQWWEANIQQFKRTESSNNKRGNGLYWSDSHFWEKELRRICVGDVFRITHTRPQEYSRWHESRFSLAWMALGMKTWQTRLSKRSSAIQKIDQIIVFLNKESNVAFCQTSCPHGSWGWSYCLSVLLLDDTSKRSLISHVTEFIILIHDLAS